MSVQTNKARITLYKFWPTFCLKVVFRHELTVPPPSPVKIKTKQARKQVMYNWVLHFSFDREHLTELNLPKLPLSPHWIPLQSHQPQSTHTTFLSGEAKMEDALEHAPTINVVSFHKTRLDLFGHQTALKKHGVDIRAQAPSVSLCKPAPIGTPYLLEEPYAVWPWNRNYRSQYDHLTK